jgi:hypothetical protein
MSTPPLIQLVQKLPSFTISKDGIPYLTRYYAFLADREFGNIFIHHFHRSDMDIGVDGQGLLHSHPWSGLSFVLSGGYREERRNSDGSVSVKIVKPFSFNYISKNDFHRVDLLDEKKGAWTIFFTGPRSKKVDWYFWDRFLNKIIPWNEIPGAIK